MGYNDTINTLKTALELYSDDERKLNELYKNALDNLSNQHANAIQKIETQYRSDRNQAYSDTARQERNTLNKLSARGLGFSGETAQAKLNSGIVLGNRFGKLAAEKNANTKDLELEFADKKNALASDQASKLIDYHDRRNKLNAEIAGMELSKEQTEAKLMQDKELSEASIVAEMERLQAELAQRQRELEAEMADNQANRDADKEKYQAQIKAEMERLQAELRQKQKELDFNALEKEADRYAEMERLKAELAQRQRELEAEMADNQADRDAEKEKYQAQLKAEMERLQAELRQKQKEFDFGVLENETDRYFEMQQLEKKLSQEADELAWEKEKSANELAAEKEQYEAEIRAKKELEILANEVKFQLLEAELKAKYNSSSGSGSSGGSSGGSGGSQSGNSKDGYSPSISAKDLGKQLVSSASGGNSTLKGEKQMYYINKYLIDLNDNYNLNSDYMNDLVLVLKSYGYTSSNMADMRIQVINYDAGTQYDKIYKENYNRLIAQGKEPKSAKIEATKLAVKGRFDYIYSCSKDNTEFTNCCKALGITQSEINTYLSSVNSNTQGGMSLWNNTVNSIK